MVSPSSFRRREHILDSIGQLPPTSVKDHLSGCPECRSFQESQQELHARFASASTALSVLAMGTLFTGFTYLLQAKLRDAFQDESI